VRNQSCLRREYRPPADKAKQARRGAVERPRDQPISLMINPATGQTTGAKVFNLYTLQMLTTYSPFVMPIQELPPLMLPH